MKLLDVVIGSVVCLALGACSVKGPEVTVRPPIEINAGGGGHGHGGFCPPGQAKKGNC